jgi:hypothetical protein
LNYRRASALNAACVTGAGELRNLHDTAASSDGVVESTICYGICGELILPQVEQPEQVPVHKSMQPVQPVVQDEEQSQPQPWQGPRQLPVHPVQQQIQACAFCGAPNIPSRPLKKSS